jgi:hypothetical protein
MNNVVFNDVSGGGYYCNVCKLYIHPDMINQHNMPNHGKTIGGGLV